MELIQGLQERVRELGSQVVEMERGREGGWGEGEEEKEEEEEEEEKEEEEKQKEKEEIIRKLEIEIE